jgi:hypothetical protein
MRYLKTLVLVLSSVVALDALAWGADAHRLIAELAERQLMPSTRAEVDRLLSLEPGASMVSVSTWADEIRRPVTAPLHYVNLPEDDCTYVRKRDCESGGCLVEAINEQAGILKSNASDVERLVALKFLIHLVGDVHQPLHAGLARDKGGNLFQVRAFGRGSNLHAVWDSELIRRRPGGLPQLMRDASDQVTTRASRAVDPGRWASESCAIGRSAGFYPEGRLVDATYQARWDGTLLVQLSLAGARLAATLNEALRSSSVKAH